MDKILCDNDAFRTQNNRIKEEIDRCIHDAEVEAETTVMSAIKEKSDYVNNKTAMMEKVTSENIMLYTKQKFDELQSVMNGASDNMNKLSDLVVLKMKRVA